MSHTLFRASGLTRSKVAAVLAAAGLLTVGLAGVAQAVTPSDDVYCSYTTNSTTTFRTGPSTSYGALYTVPAGTRVTANKVVTNGYQSGNAISMSAGWALSSHLNRIAGNCFE